MSERCGKPTGRMLALLQAMMLMCVIAKASLFFSVHRSLFLQFDPEILFLAFVGLILLVSVVPGYSLASRWAERYVQCSQDIFEYHELLDQAAIAEQRRDGE